MLCFLEGESNNHRRRLPENGRQTCEDDETCIDRPKSRIIVGIEDNLLQSRNGKNSIPKGKFSGPRPNSTKAMMLKLPVEEAVSDMTVSTWACQSKLEGAERVTRTTESRSAIPETIITSVVFL